MCMLRALNKGKKENGAVTIEATIALTTFLFMFIMIFSIITICRAQARIQIAINTTAKELSQYSYVYGLTGLDSSLKKFQDSAGGAKDEVNGAIGNIAGVFESIQSLGETGASIDITDMDATLGQWESVKGDLSNLKKNGTAIKESIEGMAENPQQLLFGMAKLIGSESLELAKSRAIAEPVCRALIKKHLKRNNADTAEAFCQSVGIVPGTYLGKESYFNGLDFSNSTLFPYGTDEINVIVTYKVKLLQLLPLDYEFTITQSAVTKGWLHGDKSSTGTSATEVISAIVSKGESVWNTEAWGVLSDKIRSAGIEELKKNGYYGVSGHGQYIHAYDSANNLFAMVTPYNPLYNVESISEVDKEKIKKDLEELGGTITSTTDNIQKVNIKKQDDKGNIVTETQNCAGEKKTKVVVIIPQDDGLKALMEEIVAEMESDVQFEFVPSYGTVFKEEKQEGGES